MSRQAVLLLRTLAYDRNLHARAKSSVGVLVVFDPSDSTSRDEAAELSKTLTSLSSQAMVAGLPIVVRAVPYAGRAPLQNELRGSTVAAVYLCHAMTPFAADVAAEAATFSVMTVGGERELADRSIAVAFVSREGRAGLVVNLSAAKQEGVDFDPALLKLAEVLRATPASPGSDSSHRAAAP